MNLIFSVFVSRPYAPLIRSLLPRPPRGVPPAPRIRPASFHRHRHQDHLYQSLFPPPPSQRRPYLAYPLLFRSSLPLPHLPRRCHHLRGLFRSHIPLFRRSLSRNKARARGFVRFLSPGEKKRINFERRRRFSAGTPFRFACASGTRRRERASSFRYYLLRWNWKASDSRPTNRGKVDRKTAVARGGTD